MEMMQTIIERKHREEISNAINAPTEAAYEFHSGKAAAFKEVLELLKTQKKKRKEYLREQ